jgi:hypothetical protein
MAPQGPRGAEGSHDRSRLDRDAGLERRALRGGGGRERPDPDLALDRARRGRRRLDRRHRRHPRSARGTLDGGRALHGRDPAGECGSGGRAQCRARRRHGRRSRLHGRGRSMAPPARRRADGDARGRPRCGPHLSAPALCRRGRPAPRRGEPGRGTTLRRRRPPRLQSDPQRHRRLRAARGGRGYRPVRRDARLVHRPRLLRAAGPRAAGQHRADVGHPRRLPAPGRADHRRLAPDAGELAARARQEPRRAGARRCRWRRCCGSISSRTGMR